MVIFKFIITVIVRVLFLIFWTITLPFQVFILLLLGYKQLGAFYIRAAMGMMGKDFTATTNEFIRRENEREALKEAHKLK